VLTKSAWNYEMGFDNFLESQLHAFRAIAFIWMLYFDQHLLLTLPNME